MSESMFARLWNTIVTLANDPDASVAKLGNILFMYIIKKVSHLFANQPKLSRRVLAFLTFEFIFISVPKGGNSLVANMKLLVDEQRLVNFWPAGRLVILRRFICTI